MKVTVCFGEVRVLVPCGAGDLLVRDLVREATHRYKKATGQGAESWIEVRALRAASGGILDPDDRVRDVADDRETLAAERAGAAAARAQRHHGGDGASGSSAGTASPDMFRSGCGADGGLRASAGADLGVVVGGAELEEGGGGLQVRRGSEPTLHQDTLQAQPPLNNQTKRWSAAVVCREDTRQRPPDPAPALSPPAHQFQRQNNRLSMQFSGPGSGNWLDAAERVQTMSTKSLPRDSRKEPLGQDTVNTQHRVEDTLRWVSGVNGTAAVTSPVSGQQHERPLDRLPEVAVNGTGGAELAVSAEAQRGSTRSSGQLLSVALVKGERGLGFTITTRDNPTGGHAPIYVKNILPKGAAVMDGRLRAGDRLVSVNGTPVSGLQQQQVVGLLRNTPTDSTVTLLVERPRPANTQRVEPQQSPTKYTEKAVGTPETPTEPAGKQENGRVSAMVSALNRSGRFGTGSRDQLIDEAVQNALNTSNNSVQAGGTRNRRVMRLDVPVHDTEKAGLGVSVKGKVTAGERAHDLGIFVKSVLHGGAASRDGRLHTNDQLLNVNGVSLVGQSNAEAMETLRRALVHSCGNVKGSISLTIARRTDSMDSLARWKDDTPPADSSGNSTSDTQHNTVIYNTLRNNNASNNNNNHNNTNNTSNNSAQRNSSGLKNDNDRTNGKRHSSIVTINNNSTWSNQSDDSKGYLERDKSPGRDTKRDSFEWSRLDGWNPVIDRLTGLRNESYYMATQESGPGARVGHHHLRAPQHNVIIEEDSGSVTKPSSPIANGNTGVYESGSESAGETAFTRDAVGRRSMSEKRHAAVDAKTTGTYKKIKEQKAINAMQAVGPTLGMRKSSSLESLQTAVQEQQRQPTYSTRRRVQHAPLKHWLTDEPGATMVRGSPQLSSLSHKKPSLLKSLSSMLKFGHKAKKPEEIYGRSTPARASEKSLSREALERSHAHAERKLSEKNHPDRVHPERTHPDRVHPDRALFDRGHSERALAERQPERGQDRVYFGRGHSERGHSERIYGEHERRTERGSLERGHLERGHDRLVGEPRVPDLPNHRSGGPHVQHAPPYRLPPCQSRVSPPAHAVSQIVEGAWGATGHYVNYREIQDNLSARREKLSAVQIGQMRRTVHEQRAKAEEESRRAGAGTGGGYHSQRSSNVRPQSNYYEYESIPRHNKLHYH